MTVSQESNIGLFIKGAKIVDKYNLKSGLTVIVENTQDVENVTVKCINPGGDDEIYDVKNRPRGNEKILWLKNKISFWRRKHQLGCGDVCNVTIKEVKNGTKLKCGNGNHGQVYCNVREWIEAVKSPKHSESYCGDPEKYKHDADLQFQFKNPKTDQWDNCNKLDQQNKTVNRDDDIYNLTCNNTSSVCSSGFLLIRIVKIFRSASSIGLPFMKTDPDCEEDTFFRANIPCTNDTDTGLGTGSGIILVATIILVIILVCLLVCYKKRRKNGSNSDVSKTSSAGNLELINNDAYVESNGDKKNDYGDGNNVQLTNFGRQCSVRVEADHKAAQNCVTEEVKQQFVANTLIEGDMSKVNPNLPFDKQASRLHYDRRYERAKDSFTIGYILGEGMFGTVFEGTATHIYGPKQTKIAVKQAKNLRDENQLTSIIGEMKIMSNLQMHPNLVNLLGACTSELYLNELYLLLEYCPFGDLKHFLVENRDKFDSCLQNVPGHMESVFNSKLLFTWSYSIAKGLEYLSSMSIMHGDLAARNILVGENYVAKISDFGLSKMMYYNEDYKKTERKLIPWAWMATEYLQTGEFTLKSDVWSYGVTIWEIFSLGNKPYGFDPYEETKVKILLQGKRLECREPMEYIVNGKEMYEDVMNSCWEAKAENRPTFSSLVKKLEEFLGDDGIGEYDSMFKTYMKNLPLLHRTETKTAEEAEVPDTKNDEGYIKLGAAISGTQPVQTNPYIQISQVLNNPGAGNNQDQEPNNTNNSSSDQGYSRHVLSPSGGYITLQNINKM